MESIRYKNLLIKGFVWKFVEIFGRLVHFSSFQRFLVENINYFFQFAGKILMKNVKSRQIFRFQWCHLLEERVVIELVIFSHGNRDYLVQVQLGGDEVSGLSSEVWVLRCEAWVWVLGCEVWGLSLSTEVWDVSSEVWGLRIKVWGLSTEVRGVSIRVWGLSTKVWGVRCKVWVLCEVSPVLQSVSVTGRDDPFRWLTGALVIQTASQYKSIMQESLSNFPVVQITNGLQIISNYRTLQVGCNCVLDYCSFDLTKPTRTCVLWTQISFK